MTTAKQSADQSPDDQLATRLQHPTLVSAEGFQSSAMPIYRASTVFFENTAAQRAQPDILGLDYSYGIHGCPTQYQLAQQLADIEGAAHALIVPSGLAAISLAALAFLKTGDHWLVPDNAYLPTTQLAQAWASQFNISFDRYNPCDTADLIAKLRPNTRLIWLEAPGSITFEIPDLLSILAVAGERGIATILDNTWSAGLALKPFALRSPNGHGLTATIQALSKYHNGHGDVIFGAVFANTKAHFAAIEHQNRLLGLAVSPDTCSLVLRGLHTLALRYQAQADASLALANWLANHPRVAQVLHPALPSFPDHARWQQFFTGHAGLFSLFLHADQGDDMTASIVDRLRLFKIGYSWGGPVSLALAMVLPASRRARFGKVGGLIRLSIGLESVADLKADLEQALGR